MSEAASRPKNAKIFARASDDWYREPVEATLRLLDVEKFPGQIWDPACGGGSVVEACNKAGIVDVFGSDKVARWAPDCGRHLGVLDFFEPSIEEIIYPRPGSIISNPPYALVEPFLLRALELAEFKVAFLLRTAFLEGKGRKERIFAKTPLARVWQFSDRISILPGVSTVKARGGAVAYAWFVWEKGWRGPPHLGWI